MLWLIFWSISIFGFCTALATNNPKFHYHVAECNCDKLIHVPRYPIPPIPRPRDPVPIPCREGDSECWPY